MQNNNYEKQNKIKIYIIIALSVLLIGVLVYSYNLIKNRDLIKENEYNLAFYEVAHYIENIENLLSKSLITTSSTHGAEVLTEVWRDANLGVAYLSNLPLSTEEFSATSKFLNQVSDYAYTLSRKNIKNEDLSQEDLKNLEELHNYSVELQSVLSEVTKEISEGTINWKETVSNNSLGFAKQVDNVKYFAIDENLDEYSGLIYDGAYSEHIEKAEKKGLTGENIDEEAAKNIAKSFLGVEELSNNGLIENGNISTFDFTGKRDNVDVSISISQKGGHIVFVNENRDVYESKISREDAVERGRNYLKEKGFDNMKETYYMQQDNILTVNYAYVQDNVTIYPDLIKLKIALDNGEILGIETSGYLNSHTNRDLNKTMIGMENAKEKLNENLEIMSESLAIIPTKWKTEILCYEFKGKVKDKEFLVYINCETGEEEDILVIINSENGTLTM